MKNWLVRFGWMTLGIAGLYGASALAGAVSGGPLDPPGSPAGTMKTLEEIPGTWSRVLSDGGADSCNTARFTCVLNGGAVRDNETGLVWERTPSSATAEWAGSIVGCSSGTAGGRGGWRLPTDVEVRSLLDPNSTQQPMLPDNHPFNLWGVPTYVWTSSPLPQETDLAYAIDIDTLDRIPSLKSAQWNNWCVRGVQADAPEDSEVAEQPPAWYQDLDATGGCFSERFRCVFGGVAALDRETGLVWQRNLRTVGTGNWNTAWGFCIDYLAGGRGGWRLPTTEELATLLTGADFGPAALPVGHPFLIAANTQVWTATTAPYDATQAYWRNFGTGGGSIGSKNDGYYFVCVRGGHGSDGN